jgi:Flp pilus assembly pilin Flp
MQTRQLTPASAIADAGSIASSLLQPGESMNTNHKQRGQGMTEYIIVVALVAIAAIGVYTAFGKTLRGQMAVTAQALAGKSANDARDEANTGGEDATTQAQRGVQLDNFDQAQ